MFLCYYNVTGNKVFYLEHKFPVTSQSIIKRLQGDLNRDTRVMSFACSDKVISFVCVGKNYEKFIKSFGGKVSTEVISNGGEKFYLVTIRDFNLEAIRKILDQQIAWNLFKKTGYYVRLQGNNFQLITPKNIEKKDLEGLLIHNAEITLRILDRGGKKMKDDEGREIGVAEPFFVHSPEHSAFSYAVSMDKTVVVKLSPEALESIAALIKEHSRFYLAFTYGGIITSIQLIKDTRGDIRTKTAKTEQEAADFARALSFFSIPQLKIINEEQISSFSLFMMLLIIFLGLILLFLWIERRKWILGALALSLCVSIFRGSFFNLESMVCLIFQVFLFFFVRKSPVLSSFAGTSLSGMAYGFSVFNSWQICSVVSTELFWNFLFSSVCLMVFASFTSNPLEENIEVDSLQDA